MTDNYFKYIKYLDNYKPVQNSTREDDWMELEEILEDIFKFGLGEKCLHSMFGIFERYPSEDNDILWGMLHGIESIPNYENELFKSIERQPSFYSALMINRILNANIQEMHGKKLIDILTHIELNTNTPTYVKECVERWIERHT